jgi:hypothetical protein
VTVSSAEVADHVACRHKLALGRTAIPTPSGPGTVAGPGSGDPTRDLIVLVDTALRSPSTDGDEPAVVELPSPSGRGRAVPLRDAAAFVRRARVRAEAFVAEPHPTAARPCDHCAQCPWLPRCRNDWTERDDLSLVAGAFGGVIDRLAHHGLDSVAGLAAAPPDPPPDIDPRRYRTLRRQARLQLAARSGSDRWEILPPDEHPGGGFALLPPPDPGDLFFDLEGDPYRGNGGLEYLWGISDVDDRYRSWWGHTPTAERQAFEAVIDALSDHLAAHPHAHVFHYASYEVDVLRRLALRYASREDRTERMVQERRLVDLYRVVRQTIATSRPGYGMKQLEHFYRNGRETDVQDGLASVAAYEAWLSGRDPALLDDIEAYNRDDCVSTRQLRDWLEERRTESVARFGSGAEPDAAPSQPATDPLPRSITETRLARQLRAGLPDALDQRDETDRRDDLLLQLLQWHRREARRSPRPTGPEGNGGPSIPAPTVEHESLLATVEAVADANPRGRAFDRFLRRTRTPDDVLRPRAGETAADVAVRVGRSLCDDYLAIQGPPDTGLPDTVARLADALTTDGRRVGMCGAAIDTDPVIARLRHGNTSIVTGPLSTFASPALRGALDVLILTGAGSASLADLASVALSASALVLCGDPAGVDRPQLRGRHPFALRRSVLSHLLDGDGTIRPDRGVLLDRTAGTDPEIVRFLSDLAYDGRLRPESDQDRHRPPLRPASGLRWVPVAHDQRTTTSPEEAEAVAALVETLVPDGAFDDVVIAAPFGDQVRLLTEVVPAGCRIGTVEQMSGQRSPIVILSLTASEPEGIPGGRNRIFSRHRLTATLSVASDLAVIVASPQLLEARCRSPRQVAQLDALIRFTEKAQTMPVPRSATAAPAS